MPELPTTLMSQVLATAMAHPIRLGVFTMLLDGREEKTAGEIAAELQEARSAVNYHLGVLVDLGCAERTKVGPSGGGRVVRHTYKAADRAYFDAGGWERLDKKDRLKVAVALIRAITADVNAAIGHGTFFDPDNNHISRSPMKLDLEGWEEVREFLDGSLDGLSAIQDRVDDRCQDGDEKTFEVKVEIIQLRSPDKKPPR